MSGAKRGASIRKGFDYQDLVAAESLLSMLLDNDGPVAVRIEDARGGKFDDISERYPDRIVWKQVKWSANPISEPFTIESLAKPVRRRGKGLMAAFARTWSEFSARRESFEIHLISNRQPDDELRSMLEGQPARMRSRLSASKKTIVEQHWRPGTRLNATQFARFVASLSFALGEPDLLGRERNVRRGLSQLEAPADSFDRLIVAIKKWATDSTTGDICAADVEGVLGLTGTTPDNHFAIDRTSLIRRDSVHRALATLVRNSPGKYVVVLASPGGGKSTILNTIGPNSSLARDNALIVYNCFTGLGDTFLRTRATAATFLRYFIREMHRMAPGHWKRRHAEPNEFEVVLAQATQAITNQKRLVIVIDGLDYARANAPSSEPALFDALPSRLPSGLTVVVSAQGRSQLPDHLRTLSNKQYFDVPALTAAQTRAALASAGLFDLWSVTIRYRQNELADAVFQKAHGHPLYTHYVLRWMLRLPGPPRSLSQAFDAMPDCGDDIRDWYGSLPAIQDAYTRALIVQLANCPYPLKASEADAFLADRRGAYAAQDALQSIGFLLSGDGDEWTFGHDSLRAYALDQARDPHDPVSIYLDHILGMQHDPRVGEFAPSLSVAVNRQDWAFQNVDADWIAAQLTCGCRFAALRNGLQTLLEDAIHRKDRLHSAKWALYLHRFKYEVDWDIDWGPVERTWCATDRSGLVLRRVLRGDELLVGSVAALRVAACLRECGAYDSAQLCERIAASTPIELDEHPSPATINEVLIPYVKALAPLISVEDCAAEIERLVEGACDDVIRFGQLSRVQLANELASHAAFVCLWRGHSDKVSQWCARRSSPRPAAWRTLLRATTALAGEPTRRAVALVRAALAAKPPMWLIQAAAQTDMLKSRAIAALKERPLPEDLAKRKFYIHEADLMQQAVRELVEDVRLSMRFGLHDRLKALQEITPRPPWEKGPFLHSAALRAALALPTSKGATDWGTAASAMLTSLRESERFALSPADRWDGYGVADALVFLLREMAKFADRGATLPAFATWLGERLIPALRDAFFHQSATDVLYEVYLPAADTATREAEMDRLEHEIDDSREQKSREYLRLAASAASARDGARAERVLTKAFRAAFTYGYRKDITALLFTDCLALLGSTLGSRLPSVVAQVAATLEVLRELTDQAELYDAASELVAAVARASPKLAARAARLLRQQTHGWFFEKDLAVALRDHGTDPSTVESEFRNEGIELTVRGPFARRRQRESSIDESLSTTELCAQYAAVPETTGAVSASSTQLGDLREAILAHVTDLPSFVQARQAFGGTKMDWFLAQRLARTGIRAGCGEEAVALLRQAASAALQTGHWYWCDCSSMVDLLAQHDAGLADSVLSAAAECSVLEEPAFMNFDYVSNVIHVAYGLGRIEEALAVFDVFADFLRALMSPYPNREPEWLSDLTS